MIKILAILSYVLAVLVLRNNFLSLFVLILPLVAIHIWENYQKIVIPITIAVFVLIFGTLRLDYGFITIALGMLMNYSVILINNNKMPVDAQQFMKMCSPGLNRLPRMYIFSNNSTRAKVLSDCLYFPYAGLIFSPGDVLVWSGYLLIYLNHR